MKKKSDCKLPLNDLDWLNNFRLVVIVGEPYSYLFEEVILVGRLSHSSYRYLKIGYYDLNSSTQDEHKEEEEIRCSFYGTASATKKTETNEERERAIKAAKVFEPANPLCSVVMRSMFEAHHGALCVLGFVIADSMSRTLATLSRQEALATLVMNKLREALKIAALKAPGFGERKSQYLDDMAILTGGQHKYDISHFFLTSFGATYSFFLLMIFRTCIL
ncbi:hypothetical protein QYF36_012335 [Acer negundo]|nr:hypothetical protein QYF36_012335 [Acer negundo]